MPAVSGAFTADALARMYAALAAPRRSRSCSPATTDTARAACRCAAPTRCSACGCGGGSATTRRSAAGRRPARPAFGHYGYGGSGGWADPDSGLSLGFVTNRIGSVSTPLGDLNLYRLTGLVRECALSVSGGPRTAGTA